MKKTLNLPKNIREIKNKELIESLADPLNFNFKGVPKTEEFLGKFQDSINDYIKYHTFAKFWQSNKKKIAALMSLHGLPTKNRNILGEIVTNITKNSATHLSNNESGIDTNSNNSSINIKSLFLNVDKIGHKMVGYWYLFQFMEKLYGKKEAKRLSSLMYSYALYFHDSTQTLVPYCYCFDFSNMVLEGRKFGKVHTSPPQTAKTYISLISDTLPEVSHHIAGACALGSIFLDLAHILIYRERINFKDLNESTRVQYYITNLFQELIYTCNHTSRDAVQSPFSNISCFDYDKLVDLLSPNNYAHYFPKNKVVIDDNKLNTEISNEDYRKFIVKYIMKLQEEYIKVFRDGDPLSNGRQFPFPVTTICLSVEDGINKKLKESELNANGNKVNSLNEFICQGDISYFNIFPSKGTKVASCCRLISNKEMIDNAASVNSFGGTSISLGSFRVVTINLMRVALETKSKQEFYALVRSRVRDCAKILASHREIIKFLTKQNFQFFIKNGWIKLTRLFGTIGVIGYAEADNYLKNLFGADEDYLKEMLVILNDEVNKINTKQDDELKLPFIINIEGIPAEQAAVTLSAADRILFNPPNFNIPELYQNQWSSLWEDIPVEKRLERDGEIQNLLTGGSIVHINLKSSLTPAQSRNIIKTAIDKGCSHFATNRLYMECPSCGLHTIGKYEKCPNCGSTNIEYLTRIIGYLSPVKLWNKHRKTLDFSKRTLS